MNIDSEIKIQELWANEQCPIVNGIIFGNGVIKRFELIRDGSWNPEKTVLDLKAQISIIEILRNEPNNITHIHQLCEKTVLERNIRLVVGEAGWGGDGFVAVETLKTKKLEFMLFFDNSNPFTEVDFVDSEIVAISNLGEKWIIPIKEPEKITVFAPQI